MTLRTLPAALAIGLAAMTVARPGAAQTSTERPVGSEADVRFVQAMIPHHAQALEMTALVAARSSRRDLALVAERIEVSQRDEIAWMTRWLTDHGAQVPGPHAHHGGHGGHALMPGMLTPDEMAQLAASTGPLFEQRFFSFMIRHHEGALGMVADLFATPGAAQSSEVFRFAADVEADQRAEIATMRALLARTFLSAPSRP